MLAEMIIRSKRGLFQSGPSFCRLVFFTALLASSSRRLEAQIPEIIPLGAPQLWQRAEFRVDHAPVSTNCFDPDLIRLDATFTSPSGRTFTVPAFWYQDFSRALVNGAEVLTPVGAPQWRIRFTPTEPGDYTLWLDLHTNSLSAGMPIGTHFTVAATATPGQHGYVRIAPDKRYFETSDGRPLHLVGENVCWADGRGTFDYDAWFGAMTNAGENYARLWLAPWFMGLEHKPGTLNHYDLQGAWQLDYIFQQAEQDDIYLLLCFDHHGMYQVDNPGWSGSNNFWKTNPYNELLGGPGAKPNDFFTNARARELYQKRLRYLIGRYGYSPHLLAWQFFNEIDNVFGPLNGDDVVAWHRQMGQWLHAHDPYGHLVTTSLTGGSERPEIWSLPELDFSMYHSYYESDPGQGAARRAQSFVKRYGKPMMVGEFGTDAGGWKIAADPYLRGFRQGLWGGALGGSVGTAMPWWWQDMQADNVYPLFAALNEILNRAGWQQNEWTPIEFAGADNGPPTDLDQELPGGEPFTAQIALNGFRRMQSKVSGEVAVASPLAAARASENLSGYLRGSKEASRQRSLKLRAFLDGGAKLTLHVKSVASDATLVVRVDGKETWRTNFTAAGASATSPREINRDFTMDIPWGKPVIEVANDSGEDWILLDSLKLERVRPAGFAGGWEFPPECIGLRRAKQAVFYVYSPWVVFPAGALRYNPPLLTNQSVKLPYWPAGRFSAQWFDPCTGKTAGATEAATEGGVLTLPLPPFNDDLAAIVTPQ
jgi:hypothetical protein